MESVENKIEKKRGAQSSSEELQDLFCALAKAQEEMEVAKTENVNPFYKSKYADFNSVVKASRKCLTKNGLSVIQRVLTNGTDKMYLFTRLCHSSGQWIEAKMPINPPKTDIQSIGSYITYLRRYNYASIVGVATSDDDDAEAAMQEARENNGKPLTEGQASEIYMLLEKLAPEEEKKLLKWSQSDAVESIPRSKFNSAKQALVTKIRRNGNGEQ